MAKDPWFKFYPSDWLGGTSGLTAAERGVYITIIAMIYEAGGPVALDRSRLARRCGVPAGSFKRILEALIAERKLIETPDGLTNERAESELYDREIAHTKRQSGARKTNAILEGKRQQNQREDPRSAIRSAHAKPEARSQNNPPTPLRGDADTLRERVLKVMGCDPISGLDATGKCRGTPQDCKQIEIWRQTGMTDDAIVERIEEIVRMKVGEPIGSWKYFTAALKGDAPAKPPPASWERATYDDRPVVISSPPTVMPPPGRRRNHG